jgi:nitrate reductase NapA
MTPTTDRREFLRASALAAAAATLHASAPTALAATDAAAADVRWDKAPCRFCGTGCHVQVGVRDDKVVAIAGDVEADVNKGLLCVKGYHVGLALYGPDRLTQPMLRKNGELQPISWDEAIDVIADRIEAHPERFAFYGSGQWTIPRATPRRSS